MAPSQVSGPVLGGDSRVPCFFGAPARFGSCVLRSSHPALVRAAFFANHHLKLGPERTGFAPGGAFRNFGFRAFLVSRRGFGPDLGGDSRVPGFFGHRLSLVFKSLQDVALEPLRHVFSANLPGTVARLGPSWGPRVDFQVFPGALFLAPRGFPRRRFCWSRGL